MARPRRDPSSRALYQGLAPGRHGLPRAEVQRHQLGRLEGAMVVAVARHGYADTTLAELVRLAGVSRTTLYAHFKDKEDCFLATYDSIVEAAMERVAQAYRAPGDWRERMRAGFSEFMTVLASYPAPARLVIVDSLALGAKALERRAGAANGFEQMLRASFDQTPELGHVPDMTIRAMVGGVRRVIYHQLTEGNLDRRPSLRSHSSALCTS